MINISSSDAFGILGKWRDGTSQLHLSMRKADGSMDGTPASIISVSDSEESVFAEIVVSEQKKKRLLDFREAFFSSWSHLLGKQRLVKLAEWNPSPL